MCKFKGGIRIGHSRTDALNFTYPFVELYATHEVVELKISLFFYKKIFCLKRENINSIFPVKSFFSQGIKIEHSQSNIPKFIIFWTFSVDKVYKELKELF